MRTFSFPLERVFLLPAAMNSQPPPPLSDPAKKVMLGVLSFFRKTESFCPSPNDAKGKESSSSSVDGPRLVTGCPSLLRNWEQISQFPVPDRDRKTTDFLSPQTRQKSNGRLRSALPRGCRHLSFLRGRRDAPHCFFCASARLIVALPVLLASLGRRHKGSRRSSTPSLQRESSLAKPDGKTPPSLSF